MATAETDTLGRVLTAVSPDGEVHYSCDAKGRRENITDIRDTAQQTVNLEISNVG